MSDRILFLSNGSICYDSTTYFIDCISEELKKKGWEVRHIRLDKGTQEKDLCALADEYDSQPFDYVFDINTKLDAIQDNTGKYCFDRLGRQCWHYILDHPFYHHDSLCVPLKNLNVICLDENHREFIKETYFNVKKCVVLPLAAGKAGSGLKSFDKRENNLIFTASYTDPDMVYLQAMRQEKENVEFFKTFTQILLNEPELTQEAAVRRMYPGITGMDIAGILQRNYMADVYLQAVIRQELVVQFIRKRVPVKLYGHNWDVFLAKAGILMKDSADFLENGLVTYEGEVTYEELPDIYNNARMSLNQLPWFKMGMHDRTPLAMINGCVSITDESRYMKERIPDGCGVVYYSLEDMEKAAGDIRNMIDSVTSTGETNILAHRGMKFAEEQFTWEKWAEEFITYVR